jgi:hypothetical protein
MDATPRRRRREPSGILDASVSDCWTPRHAAVVHVHGLHLLRSSSRPQHMRPACTPTSPARTLPIPLAPHCSFAADARHLLDKMSRPITISFNLHGRLLAQRPARRVIGDLRVRVAAHESRPDRVMCADALTVCSYAVRLREGNAVLALAILDAIDGGVFAFNSFVTM